jgi:hypothetical protein
MDEQITLTADMPVQNCGMYNYFVCVDTTCSPLDLVQCYGDHRYLEDGITIDRKPSSSFSS